MQDLNRIRQNCHHCLFKDGTYFFVKMVRKGNAWRLRSRLVQLFLNKVVIMAYGLHDVLAERL